MFVLNRITIIWPSLVRIEEVFALYIKIIMTMPRWWWATGRTENSNKNHNKIRLQQCVVLFIDAIFCYRNTLKKCNRWDESFLIRQHTTTVLSSSYWLSSYTHYCTHCTSLIIIIYPVKFFFVRKNISVSFYDQRWTQCNHHEKRV